MDVNQACFCTIITQNYWHYAQTLFASLKRQQANITLHVLVSDTPTIDQPKNLDKHIYCYSINDLCETGIGKALYDRYANSYMDGFRWSMKPVLMKHLLENGYEQVIWVDSDLFFVDDYSFLIEQLHTYRLLLTPHWRNRFPAQAPGNFQMSLREGIYNAGFVGANQRSIELLEWWAELCLYRCTKDQAAGFYVDQRYLDLAPSLFTGVHILEHKGCNIANWNQIECSRGQDEDGNIIIDEKWSPVFIHFTNSTLRGIKYGEDRFLLPYLEDWYATIRQFDSTYQLPPPKKKTWQQQTKQRIKRILKP